MIALDCANTVKDYVQGKWFITEGLAPDLDRLAKSDVPLKELT